MSGVSSGDAVPLGAVCATPSTSIAQRSAVSPIDHCARVPGPSGAVMPLADAIGAKLS